MINYQIYKENAKRVANTFPSTMTMLAAGLTVISFLTSILSGKVTVFDAEGGFSISVASASSSIIMLVLEVASIAINYFFLREVMNKIIDRDFEVNTLKSEEGKSHFFKFIFTEVLVGLKVLLFCLLLFIPGIIKAIALSQTAFILQDYPQLTAFEACDLSEKMMQGHKMEYLKMRLSFILWYLATSFTRGIANIYVLPYVEMTNAQFYDTLKWERRDLFEQD